MQSQFSHNIVSIGPCRIVILFLFVLLLQGNISAQVIRKSQVNFNASDGLLINADLFQSKKSNPYIILFHQEESCRGEFDSIVSRFIKMNYNCLAVDLRSGDDLGFTKNQTAIRARENGYVFSISAASRDIEAAIEYIHEISTKKIILFGSASSANLALITGKCNDYVNAIVAFSPGEYFAPEYELKSILSNYPKPIFIACTKEEYEYISNIEELDFSNTNLFKPSSEEGVRGTMALLSQNRSRDEYWLAMLIFFKSLQ